MNALNLLIQVLNAVIAGTASLEALSTLRAHLQQMEAEGVDPSDADWEALLETNALLSQQLSDADIRLNPKDN